MQPRYHQINESIKNYHTFIQYNILIVKRRELLKYECKRVVISQILVNEKCQSNFNYMIFGKVKAINTITKSVVSYRGHRAIDKVIQRKCRLFIYLFWFGKLFHGNNGMMKNQHYVLSKLKELLWHKK